MSSSAQAEDARKARPLLQGIARGLGMTRADADACNLTDLAQFIAEVAIRQNREPELDMEMAASIIKMVGGFLR